MKTEAWTIFSTSLPRRGEGDSSMIRNSGENSTESQLQLKVNSVWLILTVSLQ